MPVGRPIVCLGIFLALWTGGTISAGAIDYFVEEYVGGVDTADVQNLSILLTPDGSADGYATCIQSKNTFPTPIGTHSLLALGDDAFTEVILTNGASVALYGVTYTSLFVGSNGYVTFGSGDLNRVPSTANHFSHPRISGLLNDLNPVAGGGVYFGQEHDRAVITFDEVPRYLTTEANSFQIELYVDGRIRITWLSLQTPQGIAGISEGTGVPGGFAESDLGSTYLPCRSPYFTELFDALDLRVANTTLTFTPDGSDRYYALCRDVGVSAFPVDPTGGISYPFTDDEALDVAVGGGTVSLYGASANLVYISSNGRVTFDIGTTVFIESYAEHFSQRGVSALFRDLNPPAGGTVSYLETGDSWVVTFQDVPEINASGPGPNANSFQVELFFDGSPSSGVLRITYLDVNAQLGLVGLSEGIDPSGAGGFEEADLSATALCNPPTVAFDATAQNLTESAGMITVSVGLSHRLAIPIEIPFMVAGGTAIEGPSADFEVVTASPLIIPAGAASNTLSLVLIDDALDEADETIELELLEPPLALLGFPAASTVTVDDDDLPPTLNLAPVSVDEWAGMAVFMVTLDAPSGRDITLDFGTLAGSAEADADFVPTNGTLTIFAGTTNQQIVVYLSNDALDENNETFAVAMSNLTHAVVGGGGSTATATILDDDLPPELWVTGVMVPETAGTAGFRYALSDASGLEITAGYTTADLSARAPADYTTTHGVLALAPGETSGMIFVPIIDDAVYETDETFRVILSTFTNASPGWTEAIGVISGDPQLSSSNRYGWSATTGWINGAPNGGGALMRGPVLAGYLWSATTGWIHLGDGLPDSGPFYSNTTATDYGVNHDGAGNLSGYAWSATTGWVHFEQAQGKPTYDLSTGRLGGHAWSATTGWLNLGESVTHSFAFVIDDPPPVLSINDVVVNEADGTAQFTVVRSGSPTEVDAAFQYLTEDQAAIQGEDYVATNAVVVIPHTVTEAQVTVDLLDDTLNESNEVFRVQLTNLVHATVADGTGTGTIEDDGDPAPTLNINSISVDESAGFAEFTIELSLLSGQDIHFLFSTSNQTAMAGAQFVATNGAGVIAEGQLNTTFRVSILDNGIDDADTQFAVLLSGITNAAPGTVVGVGTIEDDDALPILSVKDLTVSEDAGAARFTAGLYTPSGRDLQFSFATTNGTAIAPLDYLSINGTLTITSGVTEVTLDVPIVLDNLKEPFETFGVALTAPVHVVFESGSATGTIVPASTISTSKAFSWSATTGWIHWRPSGAGAVVTESILCGYLWSATVGWINLGDGNPTNGYRYSNLSATDTGVNRDALGRLTGYAWSATTGWIHFEQTRGKPKIDGVTGIFSGYAWSATTGWINLGDNTAHYVQTERLELLDSDADGMDDAWEMDLFTDLTTAGPGTDADEDGSPDLDEFIADTNPDDPLSLLRTRLYATTPSTITYQLEFLSSPLRQYRIEIRPSLAGGTWSDSGLGLFGPDPGTLTTRLVTVPAATRYLFRVVAVRPLSIHP